MKKFAAIACCAVWVTYLAAQAPQHLTLPDAEALAVKNHPAISAALLTALAANQLTTEARSNYYPSVAANLTAAGALDNSRLAAGALNNPIIYNRLASGVTVGQLLLDFGRTANLVAQAKEHAAAEEQDAQATRAQILLQVDRAYFSALRTQAILTVAKQTVQTRQTVADQVSALAASKLKSGLDLSFANVNLGEAKLLLSSAQNDASASFAELTEALGTRGAQQYQLEDAPMPPDLVVPLDDLVAEALRNRPELAALRDEQSAAGSLAKAERALAFPTVSALASLGALPTYAPQLSNRYGAMGLNLSLPVFNGHLFQARRSEAEFRAQAVQRNVQDLENKVARDVQLALLNVTTAKERLALTADLLNQANQALDLAQTRYDLGLGSIVELTQAQLNQTTAQIAGVTARYDYQLQRAVLSYQIGELR